MANPTNPHDKFFRSSMQNSTVAELFCQHYLPAQLSHGLNLLDLDDPLQLKLLRSFWHYFLMVGGPIDFAKISQIIQNSQQLMEPIRGEFMNLAEQLQAMGVERGRKQEREEIAINLLKEKVDPHFIARISGLELTVVFTLKAQLEEE